MLRGKIKKWLRCGSIVYLADRKFRLPRIWSNRELEKFSHDFTGDVINVSAYKDEDKEGKKYRQYFSKCNSYLISNYDSDKKGMVGIEGELYIDLEEDLPPDLMNRFDVVFNHTTLEHIYNVQKAFANLAGLTKNNLIIVVPFLQEQHGFYGDFWRFTPSTLKRMGEECDMDLIYISASSYKRASCYIFAVFSKQRNRNDKLPEQKMCVVDNKFIGCSSITNPIHIKVFNKFFK